MGICASFKNRYEQVKIWIPSEPRRDFLLSGFWFNERRLREDSRTFDQGRGRKDNCVVVRIAYCVNKCMRKSSCLLYQPIPAMIEASRKDCRRCFLCVYEVYMWV